MAQKIHINIQEYDTKYLTHKGVDIIVDIGKICTEMRGSP